MLMWRNRLELFIRSLGTRNKGYAWNEKALWRLCKVWYMMDFGNCKPWCTTKFGSELRDVLQDVPKQATMYWCLLE
jgi:hypothetical protein